MWLLVSNFCLAGDISTDRPSVAASSLTVGSNIVQLETGLQMDSAASVFATSVPTMIRYGIGKSFELRVDSGLISIVDENTSVGDVGFSLKNTFLQPKNSLSMGFLAGLNASALIDKSTNAYAHLLVDYGLGNGAFWLNAGTSIVDADRTFVPVLTGGYGYSLPKNLSMFVETTTDLVDFLTAAQVGFGWAKGNQSLDVFYQYDFGNQATNQIAFGMGRRFGKTKK